MKQVGGQGTLFVISAPSGAGKTSLVSEMLRQVPGWGGCRYPTPLARCAMESRMA